MPNNSYLTIFTPTYNRAYLLPQLYESLCRQTCGDFVWSIVDDGSSDNTEVVVQAWIQEAIIPITYNKQANGGKMRAHNYGVRICTTPLFVCVDSDDYVTDNFVESVIHYWPEISQKDTLAGIIAYKSIKDKDGIFKVTCPFPFKGTGCFKKLYKNGFSGETTLVFKTDILKRFPFLEIEGEKFSTEAYAYDQIEQYYEYLLVDEAWTLCTYMPDGYTQNEQIIYNGNFKGWALYYNQKTKFTGGYLNKEKIGYAVQYMIFARKAGIKGIWRQSELKTPFYPIIWLLSYYYEWKWRKKYQK